MELLKCRQTVTVVKKTPIKIKEFQASLFFQSVSLRVWGHLFMDRYSVLKKFKIVVKR